jgi:hypothetical protein
VQAIPAKLLNLKEKKVVTGFSKKRHEAGDALQTRRYLRGDGAVAALATAGDYVYPLAGAGARKRRCR